MTLQISDLCVELGIDYSFPLQPVALQNMGAGSNQFTAQQQQQQSTSSSSAPKASEIATAPVIADLM
jgi:hypothetical protein